MEIDLLPKDYPTKEKNNLKSYQAAVDYFLTEKQNHMQGSEANCILC
jgi:hypothetical protein